MSCREDHDGVSLEVQTTTAMRWQVLLALVSVEVIYLVLGGLVFYILESSSNQQPAGVDLSQRIKSFLGNRTHVTEVELKRFIESLPTESDDSTSSNNKWSFAGSVFFAMTVVSTIGYGNLSPTTRGSRAFCCVYALIGIPITFVMMVGIGERLNSLAGRFEQRLVSKHPAINKVVRTAVILAVGLVFFLLLPAVVFTRLEDDWSYDISVYYSFITLTTIGFGDYIAAFDCEDSFCGLYRVFVGIYIFVGLAWLSGLISSIQEAFQSVVHRVDTEPIIDRHRAKLV